jgi:hypothetical protein
MRLSVTSGGARSSLVQSSMPTSPSASSKRLGSPNPPANPFHVGHVFRGFLIRICYGLPSCSPPCTDQTDMLGPSSTSGGVSAGASRCAMVHDAMQQCGRRNLRHRSSSVDQLWFGWPHIAALGEGRTGDSQNECNNEGSAIAHAPPPRRTVRIQADLMKIKSGIR